MVDAGGLSPGLAPGLDRSDEHVVEGRLLTDVGGTLGVKVLSTPGMIAVMERNAAMLAREHLPAARATVGFEICIKHVGAALEGTRIRVHARLREIIDGRKLRYDIETRALDDDEATAALRAPHAAQAGRVIGVGTHERRVIDVATHAQSAGRAR